MIKKFIKTTKHKYGDGILSIAANFIQKGTFLIDQDIEAKLAPYLVSENARISWQVCSYLSTSFLLLHQSDQRITYVDLIHSEIVQELVYFAKTEGKYLDLSIAQ